MPLPHGSTIGILGGGQLGRMTAEAAIKMGYKAHIYAQDKDEPACQITPLFTLGAFTDEAALKTFADAVDLITLEWENVPTSALTFLSQFKPVTPDAKVLEITQDRLFEKSFARAHMLDTPNFALIENMDDLKTAAEFTGLPAILKTARMGYDGKGQAVLKTKADLAPAWAALKTTRAIYEAFVPFDMEISVIIARREDGHMVAYPPVRNIHKKGILDETHVPAIIPPDVQHAATHMAHILASQLNIVGLLAVEMFVVGNQVYMNEMAPRPHNSGHWTMDFAATSQFEQFIRAITGLPLGTTAIKSPCMMKNLIGDDVKNLSAYQNNADAHIHLYGKKEVKAGRKMGHVNIKKS